jgi:hypothetical protein
MSYETARIASVRMTSARAHVAYAIASIALFGVFLSIAVVTAYGGSYFGAAVAGIGAFLSANGAKNDLRAAREKKSQQIAPIPRRPNLPPV